MPLLLIISLVAIAVRWLRIPYTVALVLAGLIITTQQPLNVKFTSELILALFVPPLLFEAAFHLDLAGLWQNLLPIVALTVPGVLITMLIIGSITAVGIGLPLAVAMVFGALLAATDPVSVMAFFRRLGAPRQLAILVEGESLFNDGTAVVIFQIAVAVALGGRFGIAHSLLDFLWLAAGIANIGPILWAIAAVLVSRAIVIYGLSWIGAGSA